MNLLRSAGDDVGDFNTPDTGVFLGSKATRDGPPGLTSALLSIFLNSDDSKEQMRENEVFVF